jgi:hypothetical protein
MYAFSTAENPRTAWQYAGEGLLFVIAGLSGPFVLIALPLFAWRVWRYRSAWTIGLLALATGDALAQLPVIMGVPNRYDLDAWVPLNGAAVVGRRFIVSMIGDYGQPGRILCFVVAIVVPLILAAHLWRNRAALPGAWVLFGVALLTLAAGALKKRVDQWDFNNLEFSDRYFFVPRVFLVWAVFASASRLGPRFRGAVLAVALACFTAGLPRFISPSIPSHHWRSYARLIEEGVPTVAPIAPEGWTVSHPGRPRQG